MWSYQNIHESQYFIGLMILLANIGSRFIVLEFSKTQEQFLSGEFMRKIFIFAAAFVATRDLIIALIFTIGFTILVSGIFHEHSRFCLLPEHYKNPKPSVEEYEKAKDLINRYEVEDL